MNLPSSSRRGSGDGMVARRSGLRSTFGSGPFAQVDLDEGRLTIQGERHSQNDQRGERQGQGGYDRSERSCGSFYRILPLRLAVGAGAERAAAMASNES